jgi:hypothetical protein
VIGQEQRALSSRHFYFPENVSHLILEGSRGISKAICATLFELSERPHLRVKLRNRTETRWIDKKQEGQGGRNSKHSNIARTKARNSLAIHGERGYS